MTYVLDAHTLIWLLRNDPRLSPAADAVVAEPANRLVVPTIALAEIHHTYARGRSPVPPSAVRRLIDTLPQCEIYPFDEHVLDRLPTRLEMHDGIIVATALSVGAIRGGPVLVVTNDREITASGLVDVLW